MKIEAVTVSVGYTHHLSKIISNNNQFDRWVIVTDKDDIMTKRFCRLNKLECVTTDRIYADAKFAKGRAINDGLARLDKDDWIVHIDSDILLPNTFRTEVEEQLESQDKLYFCARYDSNAPNSMPVDEARFRASGPVPLEDMPDAYKAMNEQLGFDTKIDSDYKPRPYGFFQMWHSSQLTTYSEESDNADFDDVNTSYHFFPRWELLDLRVLDVNPWDSNWDGPK